MPDQKTTAGKPAKTRSKISAVHAVQPPAQKTAKNIFPIVGLGASAGGLQALKSFFAEVDLNSGMAFIVVVHMSPHQPSMMTELLQKVTPIKVSTAIDGHPIEPDHIYVIPPDCEASVYQAKIQLLDLMDKRPTLPIDAFLRSLAQDQGPRAVAVILSGTGLDGSLGIKEIKVNDGLVLVQSETSAEYDGMPRSAINSGMADIILPPDQMPQRLALFFTHHPAVRKAKETTTTDQKGELNKIFAVLRSQIGHDFSQYKLNTMLRRIGRRMGLNQIEEYGKYVRFLRENPAEVEALFRDLLIGVTSFFRDAESFELLKARILPELFSQIQEDGTFRAWIPGCSTGEEVYSLVMVIQELLDRNPKRINLQLFGTDVDGLAIDKARAGLYPASITADVSVERLKQYFTREGDFFRIRKKIRDCAVFSVQDLIKDPPFSNLHLVCCRNLLIYLRGQAQKKLMPLFHYTLRPQGVLMLGSSESIGGFTDMFDVLDKKWKIFKRLEVPQELRQYFDFPIGGLGPERGAAAQPAVGTDSRVHIAHAAQKAILDQFAPTALLVDAKGSIFHIQGRTGKYLEAPSGPPSHNILDMARQGLRIKLSSALRQAKSSSKRTICKNVGVKTNGDVQMINLHICPLQMPRELIGRFLVVFEDIENTPAPGCLQAEDQGSPAQESAHIAALESELQNTRDSHQTTIEELESSNEELKSTNEELQSSNEELQSSNEELESTKEELQSLNEELQTVNAELQNKVEELTATHDDMRNLLNGTQIATIFVDNDLRVRRFTQEATAIINLIQSDVGRPLQHIVSNLAYAGMIADLETVLEKLLPKLAEVQTTAGDWYKMRIVPYRTLDNRIDGAVLTFSAISEQKQAQQVLSDAKAQMEQTWQLIRTVLDMNKDPLAVLDTHARLILANSAFARLMKIPPDQLNGADLFNLKNGLLGQTDLKARLLQELEEKKNFQIMASELIQSDGFEQYSITGQIIKTHHDDRPYRLLLRFEKEQ